MKNWLVLIILHMTLSACTIDTFIKEGSSSNNDSPATSEVIFIDFRTNGEITDIYTSYDQTNYILHQSIAGYMIGQSFSVATDLTKGKLNDEGFVVIEKNTSSPASWANKSLWHVGSAPQTFEHYMDIPDNISGCELYNHADLLNMYCYDSNHAKYLMYQVDKHTKTIQSALDKWGYVGDSTYDYHMKLIDTVSVGRSETIAVYKVLKADTQVRELVDIYVYAGSDYQKIAIDASDLNTINTTPDLQLTAQVSAGNEEFVFITSTNSNTGIRKLLVIDISTPTASTLRIYNTGAWYIGFIGNSLIFTENGGGYYKTYTTASGLQDTTIPNNDNLNNQLFGNSIFVVSNTQSYKKCSLDGSCNTLLNDITKTKFISRYNPTKNYVIDTEPNEPDRFITSIDATGTVVAEAALTALIRAQGLTMDDVDHIYEKEDYLIVQSNYRYWVFDKEATTIKAYFEDYCSGNSNYPTQFLKYFMPKFKGWNVVQNSFACG